MRTDTKVAFVVAFMLFVIGDLVSTVYAISVGGVEGNAVLSLMSFESVMILKVLFISVLYLVVGRLEDLHFMRGVVLGSVIDIGLVTTLWNVGFYGGVW